MTAAVYQEATDSDQQCQPVGKSFKPQQERCTWRHDQHTNKHVNNSVLLLGFFSFYPPHCESAGLSALSVIGIIHEDEAEK